MATPSESDPFDLAAAAPAPSAASAPPRPQWLDGLNPEQLQAVETTEGPLLVLSGAGTGKTRVLTSRLAYILARRLAKPWQVLAVTFTNRAAREMRERVTHLVGPVAEAVWLGTFHALGARMLRRHGELVGLKSNFTILDADDQLRLLKQVMEADAIDVKKWPAQALMSLIQRWKDRGLTPEGAAREDAGEFAGGRAVALYGAYQARLASLNAVDFGDLLLHCLTLFQTREDVLAEYQEQFRYILVDEYQDTNVAQYLWLRLLCRKHRNLCCVGDDDQSIYSWRGAEVGNILRFEKDFPDAKVIRLERNYRSTPVILEAASHLISHNEDRLGKTLRTGRDATAARGAPIKVLGVWDGAEEARWTVDEIEAAQRAGQKLSQIAILVRAGFQMLEFEERLITTGVPYRVVGGPRFYERMEIRDAIAYLRLLHQPEDDLAFERIINTPKRGIGESTLQKVHVLARAQAVSMFEAAARMIETDELRPQVRTTLRALFQDFARWRSLKDTMAPAELAALVLEETGYLAMWEKDKSPEAPGRIDNLREFTTALEEWDTIGAFLDHVSLVMENETNKGEDCVTLMTLHSAKGLEFDMVFLPGWEEGLFPHQRSLDENGAAGLEEERRLAYVGLTRARRQAKVSFAQNRRTRGLWQAAAPSRFVDELPEAHVEVVQPASPYGGGSGRFNPYGKSRFDEPAAGFQSGYSTPGWPRAQERWREGGGRSRGPQTLEGELVASSVARAGGYARGERVFHEKFGYGIIAEVDGNKLTIDFDKAGRKRVVDSFVARQG
ncbi:MAG: UvrD-helicase domain-containing protein [Rhodospirillaceae bacterium]|nr:UvrD-helicase domain-containing protein [Rhodospirillaceae bacterium]